MLLSSKLLRERINQIVSKNVSNSFILTCILKSFDDEDFEVKIPIIDGLKIKHRFFEDFIDNIFLYSQVSPVQYMDMLEFKSSLYCIVKIEYVDLQRNEFIQSEDIEVYYFRVFLSNTEDIFKKFHISAFKRYQDEELTEVVSHQSTLIPLTMQLFENEAYDLHRKEVVTMFSNVKIENVLKYLTAKFDIKSISIHPVDNSNTIKTVIIPPQLSKFRTIYDYIQKEYGVYKRGLGYYFFKGTLYIYPCYDTHIKSKNILNIFRSSLNSYVGALNYHDEFIDDNGNNNLDIVSTSNLESVKLTDAGLEKDGTNLVFLRGDRILDSSVKLKDDKFAISDNNAITVSASLGQSVNKNAILLKYISPTINVFKISSSLEEAVGELVFLTWESARLFRIYPATEVYFYYDKEEVILRKGIIESVEYDVLKQDAFDGDFIFVAMCKIVIRLELIQA